MADKATPPRRAPKKRSKLWRRLGWGSLIATPVLVIALWIAIHEFEWLGPMVANGLRAVIGKDAVAELENIAYGVQDRLYRYTRRGEQPKAYWDVPPQAGPAPEPAPAPTPASTGDAGSAPVVPAAPARAAFRPQDVGPVHASWSAPGDGQWLPIPVPDLPELPPHMWKTLLHPDPNRSWAELFVVAMAIDDIDLHLMAGRNEPVATVESAMNMPRPSVIPPEHQATVIGAFNGGFKTEHGGYGMGLGDTVIVAPIPSVCAVAAFDDDSILVGSWERLEPRRAQMRWFRQTPNCMYDAGVLHPRLAEGHTKKWGATLDGDTVIRRSAIGVDQDAKVLFVGISNHTTANAIALGMHHAGARSVAQLDVNFSFPKFVLFESKAPGEKRLAVALADGFEFSEDEFIRKRSLRDFFYITPRSLRSETARVD